MNRTHTHTHTTTHPATLPMKARAGTERAENGWRQCCASVNCFEVQRALDDDGNCKQGGFHTNTLSCPKKTAAHSQRDVYKVFAAIFNGYLVVSVFARYSIGEGRVRLR